MSFAELLPLVSQLSPPEKQQLIQFLTAQTPRDEMAGFFTEAEYPILSPYDSVEAADVLMQMISDDREPAVHA
jgi:hypothetical protein